LSNAAIGLIAVVVVAIGVYLAFSKDVPGLGSKYTVQAVFESASNVRTSSPVRIAGVNVGEVTAVEHVASSGDGGGGVPEPSALITMELDESALPLRTDATMKLRPR